MYPMSMAHAQHQHAYCKGGERATLRTHNGIKRTKNAAKSSNNNNMSPKPQQDESEQKNEPGHDLLHPRSKCLETKLAFSATSSIDFLRLPSQSEVRHYRKHPCARQPSKSSYEQCVHVCGVSTGPFVPHRDSAGLRCHGVLSVQRVASAVETVCTRKRYILLPSLST